MWITVSAEYYAASPAPERLTFAVVHLRMPAFSRGFSAFMWALFLGAFIWLGMVAIGITGATSFIVGCVAGLGIFLYVRVYGGDEPAQSARRERAR
jgi:hypothetical protein